MSVFIKNFCLVFLFPFILFSQNADSLLNYYPMSIGNKWQYLSTQDMFDGCVTRYYFEVEIRGDTTINNNHYYTFSVRNHTRYRRADSINYKIYEWSDYVQDDILLYKLNISDTCSFFDEVDEVELITTYSESFEVESININYPAIILEGHYWIWRICLSKNIGYSYMAGGELCYWWHELNYARVNGIEYGTYVTDIEKRNELPAQFELCQNYPNPFNPATKIRYEIPTESYVQIIVYNSLGESVDKIVNKYHSPGNYEITFDASDLPSGVYYYQILTNNFTLTRKMLLLK